MNKYLKAIVLLALGTVLLVACGSQSADVEGTSWQLMSINGEWPIAGSEITLRFEDGSVRGSSGCNTYGGDYTLENDGAFRAGPIMVTEMGCLDPEGVMDQEANYLRIFQEANKLALDEDELTIEGGGDTLVFWGIF